MHPAQVPYRYVSTPLPAPTSHRSQLKRLHYPLKPTTAHYTKTILARTAGDYALAAPPLTVAIVSSAMPNLAGSDRRLGAPGCSAWLHTVRQRIRAVLHASVTEQHDTVILGAFGCGAFGNPPADVARAFADVLGSQEYRGAFHTVVFAIVDPKQSDHGNLASFRAALRPLCAAAAPGEAVR